MKITQTAQKIKGNSAMDVSVDVHKETLVGHFLKKFHGWYKSGEAFNQQRFFTCETQYRKAA